MKRALMAPWDSLVRRETWESRGRWALLDPRERKGTWAEDLLSKERRVRRDPWAFQVPLAEMAVKA